MRVKIGNDWHEAAPGRPIAVELTQKDRENIAGMPAEATRYACFTDHDMSEGAMRQWIAE